MAYLRELFKVCIWIGCERQARVEVVDSRNRERGVFCREHGHQKLREIRREEKL